MFSLLHLFLSGDGIKKVGVYFKHIHLFYDFTLSDD